jgi:hypothetical protein
MRCIHGVGYAHEGPCGPRECKSIEVCGVDGNIYPSREAAHCAGMSTQNLENCYWIPVQDRTDETEEPLDPVQDPIDPVPVPLETA